MGFADLERVLHEDCKLDPSLPLVLGFSGGPDSLALLNSLRALNFIVIAAHLDHALRPESGDEARQAERTAGPYGAAFVSERADVQSHAERRKLSIEEAGRELRYSFLFRIAAERNAQAVAVAHNADDQAETVLMHLLRGAGPAGLRGMSIRSQPNPWSSSIPLVRPLLNVWRSEIVEYCATHQLSPLIDASNSDVAFYRNKLRHELLPLLESYAVGFKGRLLQTAELLTTDFEVVQQQAETAWARCLAQRGEGYIGLDRTMFAKEPLAVQRALLRRAAAELNPEQRDVDFDSVARAIDWVQSSNSSAAQDWLAGLAILAEEDRVWIYDSKIELPVQWPQAPNVPRPIEVPTHLQLNSGWSLSVVEEKQNGWLSKAEQSRDDYQAWVDAEKAGEELILRRPRPGDRFQPLGMESSSLKLSDFFINEKVPRRARAGWPLLCKGEEIIWLAGYRLGQPYCIRPETKRALKVSLARV